MPVVLLGLLTLTGVFVSLTGFLLVAERFLVNYGDCTININNGANMLTVKGGGTLLAALYEKKVFIPSACGGKGTCGYCRMKVLSGGGDVIVIELPYLTRAEVRAHFRLACQVKVHGDMEVQVPDLLETVRSMVANKTYDLRKRWLWITSGDPTSISREPVVSHLSHEQTTLVSAVLTRHQHRKGSIVPLLQEINTALNYLPEPALRYVAEHSGKSLGDIYRIATFYNAFSLVPRGRNIIKVCLGTACYVKRGEKILETVERKLGIKVGQRTPDGLFSIETVSCIGCCGQAPSLVINDEIYGYLRTDMVEGILDKYALNNARSA